MKLKDLNLSKIKDVEVEGIDPNDFPDFTDAFISAGAYRDRPLTTLELSYINDKCTDFVQMQVMKKQSENVEVYYEQY